jgi:hypothetical protein
MTIPEYKPANQARSKSIGGQVPASFSKEINEKISK